MVLAANNKIKTWFAVQCDFNVYRSVPWHHQYFTMEIDWCICMLRTDIEVCMYTLECWLARSMAGIAETGQDTTWWTWTLLHATSCNFMLDTKWNTKHQTLTSGRVKAWLQKNSARSWWLTASVALQANVQRCGSDNNVAIFIQEHALSRASIQEPKLCHLWYRILQCHNHHFEVWWMSSSALSTGVVNCSASN